MNTYILCCKLIYKSNIELHTNLTMLCGIRFTYATCLII